MTLLEIEIRIDKNTKKTYTVGIRDIKDAYGNNVDVFIPESEDDRKNNIKREYVGNGKVFWTDGKTAMAKDCPEREPKS
jgi:hypothetical protein